MVEFTAKGVGPQRNPYTVHFRCTALAGRADSPIEIWVSGGESTDTLALGIGLTKLSQESLLIDTDAGVFGSWGKQTDAIGTIGMGIVYPKQLYSHFTTIDEENRIMLKIKHNEPVVYHIQCDWLDGRHFNRSFNAGMWLDELRETASRAKLHLR